MIDLIKERQGTSPIYLVVGLFCLFITTAISQVSSDIFIFKSMKYLYFLQTIVLFCLIWSLAAGNPFQIFRPSTLLLLYVGLNCSLGAILYYSNNVVGQPKIWSDNFISLVNIKPTYAILSASLSLIYLSIVQFYSKLRSKPRVFRIITRSDWTYNSIIYSLALLSLLTSVRFDSLAVLAFRTYLLLAALYLMFLDKVKYRWPMVAVIVLILSMLSYDSKRTAIFMLLPVALLSFMQITEIRVSLRQLLKVLISLGLILIAVIAMSILRGYGMYNVNSFISALSLIPVYANNPDFIGMLGNNFEVNYMFFTIHHSISSAIANNINLELGATYLRALFVGIPTEMFNYKPPSIIDSYTQFVSPEFRSIGGSFPPSAIGEVFWNFGIFGLPMIPILCLIMDMIYINVVIRGIQYGGVRAALGLSIYIYMFLFIRGSGIDLAWAYIIFALLATLFLSIFRKIANI